MSANFSIKLQKTCYCVEILSLKSKVSLICVFIFVLKLQNKPGKWNMCHQWHDSDFAVVWIATWRRTYLSVICSGDKSPVRTLSAKVSKLLSLTRWIPFTVGKTFISIPTKTDHNESTENYGETVLMKFDTTFPKGFLHRRETS